MTPVKLILLFLILLEIVYAEVNDIDYHVISLLKKDESMVVIVDNKPYPLQRSDDTQILFSGEAPVASEGYKYAKVNQSSKDRTEESFLRKPTNQDTPNEFFNRSWNHYKMSPLPTLYKPLPSIHRIKSELHKEGEIPTIHLVGNATQFHILNNNISLTDYSVMSKMTYISLDDEETFDNVEVSLSGRSSTWLAKKSYSLKLNKGDDLYEYRRLKLRALATDPSYLREKIGYDTVRSLGLPGSGFSYCRVFINDEEIGLFGLIENYKNPWLANEFANGSDKYENGNLYQGLFMNITHPEKDRISDLRYIDNVTAYADGQYEIKEEAEKDVMNYEPLMNLTKFIAEAPSDSPDAVKVWKSHIDTDSVLRSMALEVLMGYADGYLTMADNYYLYDNPKTKTFIYIPSDLDLIMGSSFLPPDAVLTGNYTQFPGVKLRPLMVKILQVPEFKKQFEGLLQNVTKELLNPIKMNDFINNVTQMIEEDVKWDQSLPRVSEATIQNVETTMSQTEQSQELMDTLSEVLGKAFMDAIQSDSGKEFFSRLTKNTISFDDAVNGQLDNPSLLSIKQWFHEKTENILNYFNTTL
ncbi:coth protein-domain-containing protein [Pilobolus umbonatus]|nr:coth protein-domain-containing protein [Pilobolus umbonatus]